MKMTGLDASAPSSIDMGGRAGGAMMGGDVSKAERTLNAAARSFFQTFGDDEGNESEEFSGTIPQGLFLMNSRIVNELLVSPRLSVIPIVVDKFDGDAARIRHLYLRTLSREPTAAEMRTLSRFVKRAESVDEDVTEPTTGKKRKRRRTDETRREAAYADVLWALVSSSEFASNH